MIIKTINDVRNYTQAVAQNFPAIAGEIAVTEEHPAPLPSQLAADLQLPPIYRSIAGGNKLAGISLGFFALWPSFANISLQESLIQENKPDSLVRSLSGNTLIFVARYEANPICVTSVTGNSPDQVFLLDRMSSPELKLKSIAGNFEKFLALAANAHRISDAYEGDFNSGQEEMGRCCEALDCTPEQSIFWKNRSAEMLA